MTEVKELKTQDVPQQVLTRVEELYKQLGDAEHAYYTLDDPIMTDAEYDSLFQMSALNSGSMRLNVRHY